MRIVFIGQKGIPATFGGIEYHVDNLSQGLAERGHDVFVYVRSWYTDKGLKRHNGVRLVHIPTIKTKHLDASLHSLLSSLHSLTLKADIVHYHALGPTFFSPIPLAMRNTIITTVHRLDWDSEKWNAGAKAFLKAGERVSARFAHRIIVVSGELKDYFQQTYGKEVELIPNGVDLPVSRPADIIRDKYGLGDKNYILFLGRLVPEKRVDWLIRSFLSLKRSSHPKFQRVKLVIAGGSSATDSYVHELRHLSGGDPDVVFTGYVHGEEKDELLSNALFFVLPSYLEGFPIVLLEAKSHGLCVLASDILPHREAIKDGKDGIFFHAGQHSDLTRKLQDLVEHPEKAFGMGNTAKREILKHLSWDDVVDQTLDVYIRVLERQGISLIPR
jgi:glycosyltransferase involved in cell wall biosynthesis